MKKRQHRYIITEAEKLKACKLLYELLNIGEVLHGKAIISLLKHEWKEIKNQSIINSQE